MRSAIEAALNVTSRSSKLSGSAPHFSLHKKARSAIHLHRYNDIISQQFALTYYSTLIVLPCASNYFPRMGKSIVDDSPQPPPLDILEVLSSKSIGRKTMLISNIAGYMYHFMAYSTDAARWRALTIRDANANGHFIYSVRSTNVYCRPTCPARLARRANVGFHKTPIEAEAAGFRACKRCKPNADLEDPQERVVEKACALIEEALRNEDPKAFRLQDLAKNVGLTPRYFHKIFKDRMGMTPKEYAKARGSQPSTANTKPLAYTSPKAVDTVHLDLVDFNAFSDELVDFDADTSATLGYNLVTGAAQPSAMGFGNVIDLNILQKMWDIEFDPTSLDLESFSGTGVPIGTRELGMVADASVWPQLDRFVPAVSTFEWDATTLLAYDSLQAMY